MKKRWLLIPLVLFTVAGALFFANQAQTSLPLGTKVDLIVVEKAKRQLSVYNKGNLLRTYPIALGRSPVGAKVREGDNRTPEGRYSIDWRNPGSGYHLSMHVSYPSPSDIARGKAGHYDPGGAIMIHGLRKGFGLLGYFHRAFDWTRGCIALSNPEIDELWRIAPNGTPIQINP